MKRIRKTNPMKPQMKKTKIRITRKKGPKRLPTKTRSMLSALNMRTAPFMSLLL